MLRSAIVVDTDRASRGSPGAAKAVTPAHVTDVSSATPATVHVAYSG